MDTTETTLFYVFLMTALLIITLVLGYSYWVGRQKIRYYRLERRYFSAYLDGEEAGRKRLAEDLHDDLITRLAVLGYGLQEVNPADEESLAHLKKSLEELRSTASWARDLARHLSPLLLEQYGLHKGLESFIYSLPHVLIPKSSCNMLFPLHCRKP